MTWTVEYLKEALEDMKGLEKSSRIQVINGIRN